MVVWPAVLALVAVFLYCAGNYGAEQITRIPYLAIPYTPADFQWPFEEVSFQSSDGLKLRGWYLPGTPESDHTLLVLHGLGSNAGDMLLNIAALHRRGLWNIFLYDCRGHGASEGTTTSLGPLELDDFRQAIKFVRQRWPKKTQSLAVYGHSLGGAVAIKGAAENQALLAVAAESPFARIADTMALFTRLFHGIPRFPFLTLGMWMAERKMNAPIRQFSPVEVIGKIAPRPIFLIHGERDRRMPESDFRALWKAAGEPKESWIVPGADHGDPPLVEQKMYDQRMVGFFEKYFSPKGSL